MTNNETNQQERDAFKEDWQEAYAHWKKVHTIYDYSYLFYRSILTYNDIYGEDYLRAFGLQVFVPRTFQTIEALDAQINVRNIEFKVEATKLKDKSKAEFLQKMDNTEWRRSDSDIQNKDATKDAMIFGNGYLFNYFEDDVCTYKFPKPKDGEMDEKGELESPKELSDAEWEDKEVVKYRGMKVKALNPYYVFPDPAATSDEDWEFCYVYTPMRVDKLIKFVVDNGWMSQEKAEEKITHGKVEYFDSVRETIDAMYQLPITPFTRGDHETTKTGGVNPVQDNNRDNLKNMTAIIERYEADYYEIRLHGTDEVLYSGPNPYPHKKIPIDPVWDYKIPHEFRGMGEPEIIRWQQVEENRVHNMFLDGVLTSMVTRYGVNESFLAEPADAAFSNPFRNIRLKQGVNADVRKAIMPLPQPDVKKTPLELMGLIKDLVQGSTGATDFIVSASESRTDTATESNNLAAATSSRTRAKARNIDQRTLKKVIEKWHACYYYFYDEEMDIHLTGENWYVKFLPYSRELNDDQDKLDKAIEDAIEASDNGAVGETVEEVYKKLGYDDVIFADDLLGDFLVKVKITDLELEREGQIAEGIQAIEVMDKINKMTPPDAEKYDVMKFSKDVFSNFKYIDSIDDYTINNKDGIINPESMTDQEVVQQELQVVEGQQVVDPTQQNQQVIQ